MNIILISVLILIIILLSSYLIYKNIEQQKSLESFDNSRGSLSTFYQNTVDTDDYQSTANLYSFYDIPTIYKDNGWNGYWKQGNFLNGYFFQNNDKIIIYINSDQLNEINTVAATLNPIINNTGNPNQCKPNTFLAIGQLNNDRNYFYITAASKVLCSNTNDNSLTYDQSITGKLNTTLTPNTISLYSTKNLSNPVIFTKNMNFDYTKNSSLYAQYSTFLNPMPNSISNSITQVTNFCPPNSYPCYESSLGTTDVHYSQYSINPDTALGLLSTNDINACSKYAPNSDNSCKHSSTTSTPFQDLNCVFNSNAIINPKNSAQSISACPSLIDSTKFYDKLNFMYEYGLQSIDSGTSSSICDFKKYLDRSYCNGFILSYITNIGDVKTLNYQFFGANSPENNLTVQYDKWYEYLNNSPNGLLYNYRNNISTCTINKLSLTNIDPSSSDKCSKLSTMASNFTNMNKPTSFYKNLFPAVWNINISNNSTSNSCPVTLSTYNNYDNVPKYATFNGNNINFSLYKNGSDQQLFLENVNVISTVAPNSTSSNSSSVYVAMTCNIRSKDGMYLIPNNSNSGFSNNSSNINLANKPEDNGKWLIFGFVVPNSFNDSIIDSVGNIIIIG
jgi:hypothetical protein